MNMLGGHGMIMCMTLGPGNIFIKYFIENSENIKLEVVDSAELKSGFRLVLTCT